MYLKDHSLPEVNNRQSNIEYLIAKLSPQEDPYERWITTWND
ncbi:MAG: hypothetical protein WBN72_00655 [Nitrososphaeraceae archaeon]